MKKAGRPSIVDGPGVDRPARDQGYEMGFGGAGQDREAWAAREREDERRSDAGRPDRTGDPTWRYGDRDWATGHAHSSATGSIERDMPRDRSWEDGSYRRRGGGFPNRTLAADVGGWEDDERSSGGLGGAPPWPRYEDTASHAGRGPRGFRRTDERIHDDVCRVLTEHPGIDASDVEVAVHDGSVTLTGSVRERRQKWMAEDVLERLPGVRDVDNRIRVPRPDTGPRLR